MSESNRNSLKLDIVGARSAPGGGGDAETKRETYKAIPEDDRIPESRKDNPEEKGKTPKMAQNGENGINDGADERMLKDEEKQNLAKKDEVQFISGNQNGDAKIDIGAVDKSFTGMTKEELMKYANDPFWVRLRWVFFILFWALWAAMLICAILIIVHAPKCDAPVALKWWKQGPLVKFKESEFTVGDIDRAKKLQAKGVIYDLPGIYTYDITNPAIEGKIRKIVEEYNKTDINVILDLTPNYVTNSSTIFKEAQQNESHRSPLVWVEKPTTPNNWVAIPPNRRSAWVPVSANNYVLSTFGDGLYDLRMDDPIAKSELKKALQHLIDLGVKGFRFANAKHFIVDKNLQDEVPSGRAGSELDWEFWTHSHTTYQEGLGQLLSEYSLMVHNLTNDDGFLSVSDDLGRPESFKTEYGTFGVDTPMFGQFPFILAEQPHSPKPKQLYNALANIFEMAGNNSWLQWNYGSENLISVDPSAYEIFFMLLPGVPVLPADSPILANVSAATIDHLMNLRQSPSYMHGSFDLYSSGDLIAYSRESIKAGNPGIFVVLNPTPHSVVGNFSQAALPSKMTFDLLSANYNSTNIAVKSKASTDAIPMSPRSAAVLTYVPVKK
ncbi:4F2 cell-surface antigen heavy chain isoform X3 [Hermetia illucens]|uniref:4F2 cell-surface antigen heavy chain isoform X3 n=1 Tax=Hermetia illucens TaxID=343691 RepID=UPI0018CBF85D|nr:4F2 cell-surface antigen heavy chain isoform X3 [Hermetia illucens]